MIFMIQDNEIVINALSVIFYFFCSWTVLETPLYDPLDTIHP